MPLGVLPLEGKSHIGDPEFCQKDVCALIVEGGGDYVLVVKDNQPSLAVDIAAGLAFDKAARKMAAFSPLGAGRGP